MQEIYKTNPNKRKKLLRTTTFSVTLLVAATLLFSAVSAAVIQDNTTNVNIEEEQNISHNINDNVDIKPIQLVRSEDRFDEVPTTPLNRQSWLYYHGSLAYICGYSSAATWEAAIRFTPTELAGYDTYRLTKVSWYQGDLSTPTLTLKFYDQNNNTDPGSLLYSEPYTVTSSGFKEVTLATPQTIDATRDIWFSIEVPQTAGGNPMGADAGPGTPNKGKFMYTPGGVWTETELVFGIPIDWYFEVYVVPPPPQHDVGVITIDLPESGDAGEDLAVEVTVENFGLNDEIDVPVRCEIHNDTGVLEFLDIEYVDIPVGAQVTVTTYATWTPDAWQSEENVGLDYDIDACTLLAGDEDPANDCKAETITLSFPFLIDTAVVSINNPPLAPGVPAQTFPVGCTIKNVGQFPSCCYLTKMLIGPVTGVIGDQWYQTQYSGAGEWERSNTAYTMPASGSGYAAVADSDGHSGQTFDVELFTFSMDMTGETSVDFYCAENFQDLGMDDTAWIAIYSGGAWQEYAYYQYGMSDPYGGGVVNYNFDPSGYPDDSDVQIGFYYSTGTGTWEWGFGIDDVLITSSTVTYIDEDFEGTTFPPEEIILTMIPEYDQDVAAVILDPGQTADLIFPPWTPANLSVGKNETIDYQVVAHAYNAEDTNPANDEKTSEMTVDFFHDVGIKEITSPARSRNAPGDVLWDMDVETITGDIRLLGVEITPDEHIWLTGASDYTATYLYELAKDGTLLGQWPQPAHSTGWGWRDLAYCETDGYLYASVNTNIDQIDTATGLWTGVSYPGPGISPCRALAHNPVTDHFFTASFSSSFYEFDRTGAVYNTWANPWGGAYGMAWDDICDGPYLWVHDQYGSGVDLHQIDPATGTHTGLTYVGGGPTPATAGGLCMVDMDGFGQLVGMNQATPDTIYGLEVCETALSADIYIQPGPTNIDGIVENLGVYPETGLTCTATIQNETGGVIYTNDTAVELPDPLGGTQNVVFEDYTFVEGLYLLEFTLPLGTDLYTDNNLVELGIGADGTAPSSTHTIDPPDGLNGWYVNDLTVTLDADDGTELWQSGIDEIKYTVNGAPGTISGNHGSFVIEDDGENIEVKYWAIDNVGNEETPHNTFEVDMDQTDPNIDLQYEILGGNPTDGWDMLFTAIVTDDTSGMDRVVFYLNNVEQAVVSAPGPYNWSFIFHGGLVITIKAEGYDIAGNMADDEVLVEKGAQSHSQSTQQQAIVQKIAGLRTI